MVLISAGLGLWFSGQDLSMDKIQSSFSRVAWVDIGVVYLLGIAQVLCMFLRLACLVPSKLPLPLSQIFVAVSFGHGLNLVVPAKLGEAVKTFYISRDESGRFSLGHGAGMIVGDRLLDFVGMLTLLIFSGAYAAPQLKWKPDFGTLFLAAAGIAVVAGIGFVTFRDRFLSLWEKFSGGLSGLANPKKLIGSLIFAAGAWWVEVAMIFWLCSAQDLAINGSQVIVVLMILNLAIAVPLSFANVGTFEASTIWALGLFGVGAAEGLAVASIHHLAQLAGVATCALVAWPLRPREGRPSDDRPQEDSAKGPE